ncbi:hypothetical protein EV368DRAFT_62850 [Lentinula lateritia]|uniref:Uncharacterized protein n=1 Tax=Lentinula aff. lateritia TaxID=2804960 RepID=A0ACC1U2A1_9AGAR|nr:hypothetical protein F5876DRAFT_40275 [Lentinula aff. lateritia]KAJ3854971.1 hypothetical protein EV368DRAFT_62850 [Lentinula lateritia]
MSAKQLSSGTLSLKFMQNAQRAKQLKEVVLEKAHVEDDGQWEITKETRESWGPAESHDTVVYESSYLPFIFPSTPSSSADDIPKGRRVFRRGKEVKATIESSSSVKTETPVPPADSASDSSVRKQKSDTGTTSDTFLKKSAKLAIFDTSRVGADLRPPTNNVLSTSSVQAPTLSKTGFLKPVGVDEPKASSSGAHTALVQEKISTTAREAKNKRERKSSATQAGIEDDGPKRKKKK